MSTNLLDFPTQCAKNAVLEITTKENFVSFKTSVKDGSSKGVNYVGILHRVKIEGKKKDGSVSALNLIMKAAPQAIESRQNLDSRAFFLAEIRAYMTFLPTLTKVQQNSSLKEADEFKFVKCYHCCTDEFNEMLILEDLSADNFVMFHNRQESLDMTHASMIIERLSKFHALSFILKKQDPSLFSAMVKQSTETIFYLNRKDNLVGYLDMAHEKAIQTIENDIHREKFKTYSFNMFEQISKLVESDLENPFYVVCHGDSWINNCMFKYKNGKPVDMRLLDWQGIRYTSPVTDLLYLIFACTDSNFRRNHYEELLDHYYESLDNFLGKFSMKAQYVYPKAVFMSDLKKFSIFGLGMAVMTLLLFTCDAEDVPDVNELLDSNKKSTEFSKGNSAILYNSRINGVITDFIKYGYM